MAGAGEDDEFQAGTEEGQCDAGNLSDDEEESRLSEKEDLEPILDSKREAACATVPDTASSGNVVDASAHEAREPDRVGGRDTKNSRDKPVVDPTEFGEKINDTDPKPFWIPGGFPTIFQNETGDPFNWMNSQPDLDTWGAHILRSKGWIAQTHITFMYWYKNMMDRHHALSAKKWYVRDNPEATGYTADDLAKMNIGQLAKHMVGYTAGLPGTKASKAKLRKLIMAMVKQIEIETRSAPRQPRDEGSDNGAPEPAAGAATPGSSGDVPCLFGTLTTQRYQWDEVIRIIAEVEGLTDYKNLSKSKHRELVNKYPLFVAW
jgi:hypothetical protein